MISVVQLLDELFGSKDRRVDVSPESLLRGRKAVDDPCEGHVADDHQVHVALRTDSGTAGERTVDPGNSNRRRHRSQCAFQDRDGTRGLDDQALEILEYGRSTVRLKVDLATLGGPFENPCLREHLELSANRSGRSGDLPCDSPQEEPLVWTGKQPVENASTSQAEQDFAGIAEGLHSRTIVLKLSTDGCAT